MNELITIDAYCELTNTALSFKREITREEWQTVFNALSNVEGCVQFWIGDCLKYREQTWGMYDEVAKDTGIDKGTLKDYKNISKHVEKEVRTSDLSFSHHKQVAFLKPDKQKEFLDRAVEEKLSVRELRNEVRKEQHLTKEIEMPEGKFDVILSDPPYRYEHSKSSIRDIENHYPTMELEDICELKVPSADNAILFLWSPAPKLEESLKIMNSWGFTYRTCGVWDKEIIGMGYWFRSQHELLLIGIKGNFTTPQESVRASSVYTEKRTRHSKKPEYYYDLIEKYFPNGKYLELFARQKHSEKWSIYGNEQF